MTTSDARPVLHIPARDIPIPTSVSPEAQAVLARPHMPAEDYPALEDIDGWHATIKSHDERMSTMFGARATNLPVKTEDVDLGAFRVYVATPEGVSSDDRRVVLEIHGGAFIYMGGDMCRLLGIGVALRMGARVWAVDYRMPPEHPYPTPLDDCMAAYRALLDDHRPEEIVVSGASAGGNLAAALVLRARDEGLPLPAAAVLMTPAVDLTDAGDSLQTNLGLDPLLPRTSELVHQLYAGGHDLTDPHVSPLFGDFSKGFVPTILTTGTRDMLLSNTVRMHRALRAAGIPAELHVLEAGGHGGFMGEAPEDRELLREVRQFAESHWR
ncbi:MAG: alpha/beta hydrolase [Actinobacteria bacterium]|nr:MAG: alpha/beta hydrolase [Actinomycetota bacterium]